MGSNAIPYADIHLIKKIFCEHYKVRVTYASTYLGLVVILIIIIHFKLYWKKKVVGIGNDVRQFFSTLFCDSCNRSIVTAEQYMKALGMHEHIVLSGGI